MDSNRGFHPAGRGQSSTLAARMWTRWEAILSERAEPPASRPPVPPRRTATSRTVEFVAWLADHSPRRLRRQLPVPSPPWPTASRSSQETAPVRHARAHARAASVTRADLADRHGHLLPACPTAITASTEPASDGQRPHPQPPDRSQSWLNAPPSSLEPTQERIVFRAGCCRARARSRRRCRPTGRNRLGWPRSRSPGPMMVNSPIYNV